MAIISPNEVERVVIGGSGGTFSISNGTKAVAGIASNVSLATFQTDVDTVLGAGVATVACDNGAGSCNGGPFQIVFNGSSVAGTAATMLALDSSSLTNANNLVQVLTIPAGTGSFWAAYPNGSNELELTNKLSPTIGAPALSTALGALSGLSGHVSSVTEVAGDTIAYVVKLNGITDAKTLSVAGGFSLQFAANLGGLAGVQTTGDIIPLARLVASATFGIDLNPTTSIAAGPAQFTSGPRIDATTTHDGGKALTLDVIRPGVLNQAGTVMILTVNSKSAGTFTLGGVSGISADVDETTLKNDINGISGAYNVNVTKNPQQAGNVYTITFDKAAGPVSAFTFDGSGLQARDEVQQVNVVNTHSGSFTLTFGGQTTDLIAYNADPNSGVNSVQSKLTALSAVGSGNATVAGSAGSYAITFAGTLAGANQGDITADSSQLKGALDDGNLTDAAAFSVSVSNDSAVITAITKDGTSSVSIATTADGGNGLGVNTTTNGAGPSTNEVQTVTVRGSGGTFTLTFGGQTATGLAYNISAGALQSALEGLSSIGTGNVSVTSATTVGGTVYTITFQGTLAHANQAQLVPSAASGITARDELQQLTITGASGGTFALGCDLDTSGSISPSETTAQIAYNARGGRDPVGARRRPRQRQHRGHSSPNSLEERLHAGVPGNARRREHEAGHGHGLLDAPEPRTRRRR